jgi:Tfp pilus assembly protein PilO
VTLFRRIAAEKRGIWLPLLIALGLNVLAYFAAVRPMASRSAGAADRATVAATARRAAERELRLAKDLVNGKARADEELNAFYQKVLPVDLPGARRMTYSSLPALAKRTNVRYETRRFDTPEPGKNARLAQLVIRMVLQGQYGDIRRFIYELERAPEFVIIDDVNLTEGADADALTLRIDLSTYFGLPRHGA